MLLLTRHGRPGPNPNSFRRRYRVRHRRRSIGWCSGNASGSAQGPNQYAFTRAGKRKHAVGLLQFPNGVLANNNQTD